MYGQQIDPQRKQLIAVFVEELADVPAGAKFGGSPAKPMREHMREVATLTKLAARKSGADKDTNE